MTHARIATSTVLLMCIAMTGAGSAWAGPNDSDSASNGPSISWSVTYASRYSFQGLDYSEGRPVLQPEISAGIHGLSLALWGNLDQTRRHLDELDVTLQHEYALGSASGAIGYAYLEYPNRDWDPTHELVADLTLGGPLEPSISVHWDVDAGRGRYLTFGLDREIPWGAVALGLGSKLYVQDHYYGLSGIPAVETSVSATVPWRGLSLQSTLSRLSAWPNGDFRDDEALKGSWVLSLACSTR